MLQMVFCFSLASRVCSNQEHRTTVSGRVLPDMKGSILCCSLASLYSRLTSLLIKNFIKKLQIIQVFRNQHLYISRTHLCFLVKLHFMWESGGGGRFNVWETLRSEAFSDFGIRTIVENLFLYSFKILWRKILLRSGF